MYARGRGVHQRELVRLLALAPLDDEGGTHPCSLLARIERAYRRAVAPATSDERRHEALRYAARHLKTAVDAHRNDTLVCESLREAYEHARSGTADLDDMLSCTIEAVAALAAREESNADGDGDDDTSDDASSSSSFSDVSLCDSAPASPPTTLVGTTMQDIATLLDATALGASPRARPRRARTISAPGHERRVPVLNLAPLAPIRPAPPRALARSPSKPHLAAPVGLLSPRGSTDTLSARDALAEIEAQLERGAERERAPETSYCVGGGYEQLAFSCLEKLCAVFDESPHEDASTPAELALFWLVHHLLKRAYLAVATLPDKAYGAHLLLCCARLKTSARHQKEALRTLKSLVDTLVASLSSRSLETSAEKLARLQRLLETLMTLVVQACARVQPLPVRELDGSESRLLTLVSEFAREQEALSKEPASPRSPTHQLSNHTVKCAYAWGAAPMQALYDAYAAARRPPDTASQRARFEYELFRLLNSVVREMAAFHVPSLSGAQLRRRRDALLTLGWHASAAARDGNVWSAPHMDAFFDMIDVAARARAYSEREHARLAHSGDRALCVRAALAVTRSEKRLVELSESAVSELLRSFAPSGTLSPRRASELAAS